VSGAGPARASGRRRPVSLESRFTRRADRPYTEVAGHSMVLVLERRSAYEIAPGALALWASLGDRTLGDLITDLDPNRPALDYLEVVRRWRALGLIEERDVLGVEGQTVDDTNGPASVAELRWRSPDPAGPVPPSNDDPLEWFAFLLGWVADEDLYRPGLADALAALAEQPDGRAELAARLCGHVG
jgi:hypothetical protein